MKAIVIDQFGGPNELMLREVPTPGLGENDVIIQVEYAGVGTWDAFEREGGYDQMLDLHSQFPYILGSEGSGVIVDMGSKVERFVIGDKVYAPGFLNPSGGFYAEYVSIDSKYVSTIPNTITMQEAGVISGVGITALRGLEDVLMLKKDERVMIFGASGGIGHLAVQLAVYMGAKVFAVASGEDGVKLIRALGVADVVDGHREGVLCCVKEFAPDGFDAALFCAGGEMADSLMQYVRSGGRIAYPNGIYPIPTTDQEVSLTGYHGEPDSDIIDRLKYYINTGKIHAHIETIYSLADASKAHIALDRHFVGKFCLDLKSRQG